MNLTDAQVSIEFRTMVANLRTIHPHTLEFSADVSIAMEMCEGDTSEFEHLVREVSEVKWGVA